MKNEHLIIAGVDLSTSSPAAVKLFLDENLEIKKTDYIGFNSANLKKYNDKVESTKAFKFKDEIIRNITLSDKIVEFVKDCDYIAVEGYSYGSPGRLAQLGEFASLVKSKSYLNDCKIRIYDINSIKKMATGFGNADKFDIHEAYVNSKEFGILDLDNIPVIDEKKRKSGVSPYSDILDAYFIVKFLQLECQLRRGIVYLKDLPEEKIAIFNRVTKSNPTNILDTPFLERN